MTYYTLVGHSGICPQWREHITVSAKYRFVNPDNPHEACFTGLVTCPIIENFKLPERKRKKEYGLYRFCKKGNECELLNFPFNEVIDVRDGGRAQQKTEFVPEESGE